MVSIDLRFESFFFFNYKVRKLSFKFAQFLFFRSYNMFLHSLLVFPIFFSFFYNLLSQCRLLLDVIFNLISINPLFLLNGLFGLFIAICFLLLKLFGFFEVHRFGLFHDLLEILACFFSKLKTFQFLLLEFPLFFHDPLHFLIL